MQNPINFFCNSCQHETLHDVLCSHDRYINYTDDGHVYTRITSQMVKCRGCETTSFRVLDWFSEDYVEDVSEIAYPPRSSRKMPEWIYKLDDIYEKLLSEVYIALQNKCNRLAMMGIRSVIDVFISSKVQDYSNFSDGLKKLVALGVITNNQRDLLKIVIEAGNASIHRQYNPPFEILTLIMDTVETLLHHEALAPSLQKVKDQIPARKK